MVRLALGDWMLPTATQALKSPALHTAKNDWSTGTALADDLVPAPAQSVRGYPEWKDKVATPAFQEYYSGAITLRELRKRLEKDGNLVLADTNADGVPPGSAPPGTRGTARPAPTGPHSPNSRTPFPRCRSCPQNPVAPPDPATYRDAMSAANAITNSGPHRSCTHAIRIRRSPGALTGPGAHAR